MRLGVIILMLAITASIPFWLWPQPRLASVEPHQRYQQQPIVMETPAKVSVVDSDAIAPNHDENNEEMAAFLVSSKGRDLIQAIEALWIACRRQSNCEQVLVGLRTKVSEARYTLIAQYPQLKAQWQEVLGDLSLNEHTSLNDKVAQVKRQANEIWGELAEVIFSDQFALYEFSIESQSLQKSESEDYLQDYQDLLNQWQGSATSLALNHSEALYEKGVSLIPKQYTDHQHRQIKQQLAQRYLTEEQTRSITEREQQVERQHAKVSDYQTQLSALNASLDQQRATMGASMPESEWQAYRQQQVSNFRIHFYTDD
ncbi:hypothetical protein [Vibrio ostreicida]|uniref:hypothetical protein n=1 Tax=Vibrio ostreicida TaxID=526588 RepID=UPI0009709088|nr:hypothetical protein [Vibrio ostreicida]